MLYIDAYKTDHVSQYPPNTQYIYSNLTPRQSRIPGVDEVIFYGLQYFIKEYLITGFNVGFFNARKEDVVADYKRRMDSYLGEGSVKTEHIEALHDLGYLPICIKAVPEGTRVPIGVPMLTIVNTKPEFYWLTNYIETLMSNVLWKPITSATIADIYYRNFLKYAEETGYDKSFIQWQGHDFSFRGMSGIEDALTSASAHLLSFTGSDTIPSVDFIERYYHGNCIKELLAGSVPATEHSVMCAGGEVNELDTFKRLITEIYPSGIVSIVSDSWDFFNVLDNILPILKDDIMNRNGRVVIRPDSGDPADIICGRRIVDLTDRIKSVDDMDNMDSVIFSDGYGRLVEGTLYRLYGKYYELKTGKRQELERVYPTSKELGAIESLYNTFGGHVNDKGYIEIDTHIGLIYGDSITIDRQLDILQRLKDKGFSANNLVLGLGSFTYEYVTRDTFGMAMKATYAVIDGKGIEIYKNPKTDSGFKKSAKGLLNVSSNKDGKLILKDQCTAEEEATGCLRKVFQDGYMFAEDKFKTIRERVRQNGK